MCQNSYDVFNRQKIYMYSEILIKVLLRLNKVILIIVNIRHYSVSSNFKICSYLYFLLFQCVCYMLWSQLWLLVTLGMSDVHEVLSTAALLSSWSLMPMPSFRVNPSHVGLPFFLLLSIFHHYCLFQTTVASHNMPDIRQLQFCHFYLQQCFSLNLLQHLLVCCSGGPQYS